VTGQASPVGDPFDVDFVAHEIGHQFGGNHTQNNNCQRSSLAAREPGSASSIMGYAGICAPNVQSNSDATFHGYSMQEIHTFITGTGNSCAQVTSIANNAPVANAGSNHTIPRSTPFVLEGNASDADAGDVLSYKWDQMDNQVATQPPVETNTSGPSFRLYVPQASPDRYLPRLSDLVNGTNYDWEQLSSVSRDYNFRLTVLDNASGAGCNDQDDMVVTVDGNTGPFLVTSPNSSVSLTGNANETITWDVAGTTGGAVNAANVDIFLSVDGGFTYPHVLATAVPNDGSQVVVVPDLPNTTSRVMVRGAGNIFFDISDQDFTILQGVPDFSLNVANTVLQVCQPASAVIAVDIGSSLGFTDPVTLSVSGLPVGVTGLFVQPSIVPGNSSDLTITGTGSVVAGSYDFDVIGTSSTGSKTLELTLLVQGAPAVVALDSPLDAAVVNGVSQLSWLADGNADTYEIEIADDPGFGNVLESIATAGISFNPVVATVITDRYGNETTWEVNDGTNVFASGGPYAEEASNGEYPQAEVNACLPAGCYTLVVNDSFGDGICCAFGNGEITVTESATAVLLATAGSFGASVSIGFEVGGSPCINTASYLEDFDGANCSLKWNNVAGDDFDWSQNAGTTPSNDTGPSGDHTSGTGNYFYTESSNPVAGGDVALLESSCLDLGAALTVEIGFWYHMLGPEIGSLELQANEGGVWNSYWTLSGDQGDLWTQANVSIPAAGVQQLRFRAEVGTLGNAYQNDFAIDDITMSVTTGLNVNAKVMLQGPYNDVTGLMDDGVRAAGLIPLTEPYTSLGLIHVGGGGETVLSSVLNSTGQDAIVDWIFVELRAGTDNTSVVATRSALLQADGDIVDVDGISPVVFEVPNVPYFLVVKHRNHLGCMTSAPFDFGSGNVMDLTSTSAMTFGTEARNTATGIGLLWMGNVVRDGDLKYTGNGNDRDPILVVIGGSVPTAVISAYAQEDVTMDGNVKYTGPGNDRDPILVNIGGAVPTAVRQEQLP